MMPALVFPFLVSLSVSVLGSVGSGSVVLNSNAIKNPGGEPEDLEWLENHNLLIDPIQSLSCLTDADCGETGFCFATRASCLPCRRRRKRCTCDAMCCPGNRCSNGLEGERCLRSSDCADGLCCARHFWSKICKPVLREGQVCTKHRKKGALGLEIFQRCDCGAGLVCRTQSGAEQHRLNKAARSLHICQQR